MHLNYLLVISARSRRRVKDKTWGVQGELETCSIFREPTFSQNPLLGTTNLQCDLRRQSSIPR